MLRSVYFGVLLCSVAMLSACGQKPPSSKSMPNSVKPLVNPRPVHFIGLITHVAKGVKNFKLVWQATYYTTNPECNYIDNHLEGSSTYWTKSLEFALKMPGSFKHKFFFDRYLPGKCGWALSDIQYQISWKGQKFNDTVNTGSGKYVTSNDADVTIRCSAKGACTTQQKKYFSKLWPAKLSTARNYTYQLNLMGE